MKGSCRVFDRPRLFCSSRLSSSPSQGVTMKSNTFTQTAPAAPRRPGARAGKAEPEAAGQRRGNLGRRGHPEAPVLQPPEAHQEPAEQRDLAVRVALQAQAAFRAKAERAEPARLAEVLDSRALVAARESAEQAGQAEQEERAPSAAPREWADLLAQAARAEAEAPLARADLEARAGKQEVEARGERSTEPVCASSPQT